MALANIGRVPDQFNMEAKDLSKEFCLWLANFEDYVSLVGSKMKPTQLKSLLLNCGGLELRHLSSGLTMTGSGDEYEDLKQALHNHFCPQQSTVYERYIFRSHVQRSGESICNFVAELRKLAKSCEFDDSS
jgi:hypothetical protein